ncbi:MAG: 2,3-bisphosphoglycerate-independent phosphoglycerate mutase [Actinobacteria bacterium]|nr:2,3-bisphosphoglycerate-independent phosphoglycerate mutase [Actinomycetota bacterium]
MSVPRPFLLAILDGWGVSEEFEGNAIEMADTPVMDELIERYENTALLASGRAVGLPPGQMGNSEVGHLNIGAGRVVMQDLERINFSIDTGEFYDNQILLSAIEHVLKRGSTLHFMGLLSDGGVHSHIEHLFALIDMAEKRGVKSAVTHAFLDGRDVPPRSAIGYVEMLDEKTGGGIGSVRTISGRYYSMDRDNRWDRTKLGYDAIVHGEGLHASSGSDAVRQSYADGIDDEFLVPRVVGEPVPMSNNDAVIFFNFRPDRARQLTRSLITRDFDNFDRGQSPVMPYLVTMTEYDEEFRVPVAFPPERIKNVLADVLAENGRTQLHIAETEKYAHVTYFFNGGEEEQKVGEDRILIPSPHVATYDLQPEMSAFKVAADTAEGIRGGKYDFIVLNFANCDMVGHSGFVEAAVKAVEAVDRSVGTVLEVLLEAGGAAFITADHGNAEKMIECDGGVCTAHSTGPVPFISILPEKRRLRSGGKLADIAPSVLEVMNIDKPEEMTGESLLE